MFFQQKTKANDNKAAIGVNESCADWQIAA
jgi:hypothetical protein